jgi:ferric-dicitrate binding protein FerR (iron transport regulator)
MSSSEDIPNTEHDVGNVLRSAGRRCDPPEDLQRSVRAAVEAEWREVIAVRSVGRRRRRVGFSVAAAVVLAGVALWAARPVFQTSGRKMAAVSVAMGSVRAKASWLGGWQPVTVHQALRVGETLATSPDGRVALALSDNLSIRLDHDTRIAFCDPQRITIESGAVYVDSGRGEQPSAGEGLQIVTPVGAVHHIGTQYEARIIGTEVRIAVREGKIELETRAGAMHRAAAGEQMTISSAGSVVRSAVSPYGARWQWVSATAPSFDIEGRTLAEFLTWAARELGREVVFDSAASQAEAARVRLSGSIAGLSPENALAAVLPTTPLRSELRSGQLLVSFSSATR